MRKDVALQVALRQRSVRTELTAETLLALVTLDMQFVGVAIRIELAALFTQNRVLRRVQLLDVDL